jgi:hypothetical protein
MGLSINGYKVTDCTGHAFPTKSDEYKLEPGKVVGVSNFDPDPGNARGIYFGDAVDRVVDMGIDAANCDPRYRKDPNLLPRDGIKIFEVEGRDAVRLDEQWKGDVKCREIKVLRELSLNEILEQVGQKGTWRALEFMAACLPPGMLPLLRKAAEVNPQNKGGIEAGANLNPRNPDHIVPGDVVGLNDMKDKLNRQTKEFFTSSKLCIIDRIGQFTHFAQVRNERGETHRLNIAFLKRLGPGPLSGGLSEFCDDRPMLLPAPGGPTAPSGAVKR